MVLLLTGLALAHGPGGEGPTAAAHLEDGERYILPDPLPSEAESDARVALGSLEVLGSYDMRLLDGIRACYQLGLEDAEHPAGTGRIAFQTTLYTALLKTAITIGTDTLEHPEIEDCVARLLSAMSYPPPRRGTVTLTIPVEFSGRLSEATP